MKISILILLFFHNAWGIIDETWWKHATMYQVLVPSYMDSNGDGYGDLRGLQSKLEYLKDLGIDTILVTPINSSPNLNCAGYDITNYMEINPIFGTMKDFENLIQEMNDKGMKLIMDLVINHSSDQHPWFAKSVRRENPYTDYYIWKNAKGYDNKGNPIPPNNWQSITGGSAWEWHDTRKQYYLHQFIGQMPDLNLRNSLVVKEIKKILEFWSYKGVAGFRVDAADHLMEDFQFRNEPFSNPSTQQLRERWDQSNIFTQYDGESYEFIHKLFMHLRYLNEDSDDYERIITVETHSQRKELYQYYGSKKYKVAHFPLNFWLTYTYHYENAYYYRNIINGYLECLPEGAVANWNSENHDIPRRAEPFNEEYELILTTMVLLLPGVAYIYYGQELGLTGWHFPDRKVDSFRLPMQWDDSKNAGFSTNPEPYLPVSPSYDKINVKIQKFDENSHYNKVKKMISWRKSDVLKYGSFKSYVVSTWVYSFVRKLGTEMYLIVTNLGKETESADLKNSIENLPDVMIIELASRNSEYRTGDEIKTDQKFKLKPHVVVVLCPKKH